MSTRSDIPGPPSALDAVLRATAATVLEELTFLLADPDDGASRAHEADEDEPACLTSVVCFTGPRTGRLELVVPEALATEMACNMLGDDAATAAQQRDATGEIANIICGNVLPALGHVAGAYHLEVSAPAPAEHAFAAAEIAAATLDIDGARVDVRLFAEGDAGAVN